MKAIILSTVCLLVWTFSIVQAETEIGIIGQLSYSDQYNMEKPRGYGIHISQSFSSRVRLQFQYDYISQSQEYFATVPMPGPHTEGYDITDYFHSKTWAHTFELSIIYRFVRFDFVDLDIGVGPNIAVLDADIVGQEYGLRVSNTDAVRLGVGLRAVARIKFSPNLPLALNIGGRLRIEPDAQSYKYDRYHFYEDVSLREIFFGFSYLFFVNSQ